MSEFSSILTNADDNNTVQVELYKNFKDLESIQQEWDDFVESMEAEIFLTFDWCKVWWKYYGEKRELQIFLFRISDKIVGILPLFIEKIWLGPVYIRVIKIVGSDFTISQLSIPIHKEYLNDVINSLYVIISKKKWDVFYLGPVAGKYNNYENLLEGLNNSFLQSHNIISTKFGEQTYFHLTDNWEDYLSEQTKNLRQNLRRNYNKIKKKLNLSIESSYITGKDFEKSFDEFVKMHQIHWNNLGKSGHFGDWPMSLDFHREISKIQLARGRTKLLKINIGDTVVGYVYQYKFADKYFHLLNSRTEEEKFADYSIGRIVMCEQFKKSIDDNNYCIDDMRGYYEHKLRFGGELFDVMSIYIKPKKFFAQIRFHLFRVFARLLDICYYKIWFGRIYPRLPLKNRSLWKIWIRIKAFS